MTFWAWFFQRITGLFLLLLLIIHVYLSYFASPGSPVTSGLLRARMHSPILLVDLLLLYVGLYHGLYGIRAVLADILPAWNKVWVTGGLTIAGLCLALYGTNTLFALLAH